MISKIIIPIHLPPKHWLLVVINPRRNPKTIEIYDSLRDSNVTKYREIASNLIGYLHKEWKDKKVGGSCDKAHWKSTLKKGIPQQNNGVDCGVFVIRFAQSLAEGMPLKLLMRRNIGCDCYYL
eukprot:467373_1